jgi:ATP-dependent helicase YprA (DUF1998 family)/very-short-patch-repair endonuclease
MEVFELRNRLVEDYGHYISSFIEIRDDRIRSHTNDELANGLLWPDPLIQLNPSFEPGETIQELVGSGILHPECNKVFRRNKDRDLAGYDLRLHRHQAEAIKTARNGVNYVLTTGTGSGKSLAYIIPMVDHVLRRGSGKGIQGIAVYPMNALANSQLGELEKFLCLGYPDKKGPVTFARYTGQENDEQRQRIIANPPDILLTNYVMLELLLTRPFEKGLIDAAKGLRFLVLDELHTYRGRQGADVAMLVRRARNAFDADELQCVGTSATIAGSGTYDEQRAEVARVASLLFGTKVLPANVIGETLRRCTPEREIEASEFIDALQKRIENIDDIPPAKDFASFTQDPLSIWIESTFGIRAEPESGRAIRVIPRSMSGEKGAGLELSRLTGVSVDICERAIEQNLMASYECEPNPETGFPVFAFRLHQFFSRGDSVYASPEPESTRHITLQGQQYVPGDRERVLLPLVFCRECGQEYYCVQSRHNEETGLRAFRSRELSAHQTDQDEEAGFLYINTKSPWPAEPSQMIGLLPEDWLEERGGEPVIRRDRRDRLPQAVRVSPKGMESEEGLDCHFLQAPFRFCLNCGVSYGFRQSSDFPKLASLATEGRSSATTILTMAAQRYLRGEESLAKSARKVLTFTDNRQDASLQAGHFNDFVEVGLLRSAHFRAVRTAGPDGLTHEDLLQAVFNELNLPLENYASDPEVLFLALENTKRAFREVIGYRLYRDLKRGWRVSSPNLEQCGLIEIKYISLEEMCRTEEIWRECHGALASASSETRFALAKTLLDSMRRDLAVKVDYLNSEYQDRIRSLSSQHLKDPWALEYEERPESASVLYPRGRRRGDFRGNVYLSPRGGFGQYIRRRSTIPEWQENISVEESGDICRDLLSVLRRGGLVEEVSPAGGEDDVAGYQMPAAAMRWVAGDGTRPFHDPVRMPNVSETGGRTNPFFVEYYRSIAEDGIGLEAREHTAQVKYEDREEREERFRKGDLPVLYCSPTMELGVDIAELNVVGLRNIPPTPANYAQRSGRAGRSGQPALVFSYCSTFSSHDQFFFRRPERMVAGAVTPPRLDLANMDLVQAHMQAIWLAEIGVHLGSSLSEVLDHNGEDPTFELSEQINAVIHNDIAKDRAMARAKHVLATIQEELEGAAWYEEGWLESVLNGAALRFDQACDRWRGLYRSALRQRDQQHKIILDASRSKQDKDSATRLRAEAESQIRLLTDPQRAIQSDFYSYRYFASEGFLPGYNFPRLPLSAYIPGRRRKKGDEEYLSRPRFLAISEFGPRAIIYHDGVRYRINKAILPIESEGDGMITGAAKQCASCGYMHPIRDGAGPDLCERCQEQLGPPLSPLFRLQNVVTQRTDRINSDEEERLRIGYEIQSGIRFAEDENGFRSHSAKLMVEGEELATLTYGDAATIWRINRGWRRRANQEQLGFVLDTERGYWARNNQDIEDDRNDPMSPQMMRVIPYVEDHRNCLLLEFSENMDISSLASIRAAIKTAIQVQFQLEEMELAAEILPSREEPRLILFYESAEGGAGALRRLLEEPQAWNDIGKMALEICHFDSSTGNDLRHPEGATEDCEAACYDCLMTYSNQMDHEYLDRMLIRDLLMSIRDANLESSPSARPRLEHLAELMRLSGSDLERDWLNFLVSSNLRLPSGAQKFMESCKTRPDFLYEDSQAVIYIDGSPHDFPDRQERDAAQTECMEDIGYTVIRFHHQDNWRELLGRFPHVFGKLL